MWQRPYVACEAPNISHLVFYRSVLPPALDQLDEIVGDDSASLHIWKPHIWTPGGGAIIHVA